MSAASGTTAEDYSKRYYAHYSDTDEPYDWESPGWREWFRMVARGTLAAVGPVATLLDVGCAKGLLVQAFAELGVDSQGFDLSTVSIDDAHPDVRERLWVASVSDPIQGRFDLVTCVEVLEHLGPRDAQAAIDHMCAVTDRILLSSTPGDFDEPTHVNVHSLAAWVAAFAARGFFRRVDVDLGFLTPWAVCFERAQLSTRDLAHRYESHLYPLVLEVNAKRQALLEAHRELARLDGGSVGQDLRAQLAAAWGERAAVGSELTDLRHQLLLQRDHAIGREAAAATARIEADRLRHELAAVSHELTAIKASERWKIGGAVVAPVSAVKRQRRR